MISLIGVDRGSLKCRQKYLFPQADRLARFGQVTGIRSTDVAQKCWRQLKASRVQLRFAGLSNGSDYIANRVYRRNVTSEQYIQCGRDMTEAGFDVFSYDVLSRCPFEREEDIRATALLLGAHAETLQNHRPAPRFFPFARIKPVLDKPRFNGRAGDLPFCTKCYSC